MSSKEFLGRFSDNCGKKMDWSVFVALYNVLTYSTFNVLFAKLTLF